MTIKNFFTQSKKQSILRKMQYFSNQEGMMNRYISEKENWDKHLNHTKKFILESSKNKKKDKAVILGSGWLLDLPLKELSSLFKKLIFIDIHHPKQVVRKVAAYPNVFLIKDDITGGLVEYAYERVLLDKKQRTRNLLSSAKAFSYVIPGDTDFVVSLNIMCQLHVILIDSLKKMNVYSLNELKALKTMIQQNHLNMLPKDKTCLITDFEEEIYDEDDNLQGVNPLLNIDLPRGIFHKKWQWKFDSKMIYREDAKTFFNTIAIDF